ncbi:MAG: sulfur carrier protein ThiS [Acidobacteria bacterium]|nr:sulfur carrier protein ThiS [Acidobacteriota bacterium]
MMTVFINGEARELDGTYNLLELLRKFSLPDERVAIELNKTVVRKRDWENIRVADADRIEIVHFVGGG